MCFEAAIPARGKLCGLLVRGLEPRLRNRSKPARRSNKVTREVLKILLVLAARIVSEICFGVALIIEKIIGAILHLLLLLAVKAGSLINQATRELVELAGYGVSSAVFITITVFILWFLVPVLEEVGRAILRLNTVT